MNVLETIIAVILIVLCIMTWVTEPKLSWEYSKAYVTSGKVAVVKVIEFVNGFSHSNTTQTNVSGGRVK